MTIVGEAVVVIRALTDKIRTDIVSALKGAEGDVDRQGAVLGGKFGDQFGTQFGDTAALRDNLGEAPAGDGGVFGKDWGDQFGREAVSQISSHVQKIDPGLGGGSGGTWGSQFGDAATKEVGDRFKNIDVGSGTNFGNVWGRDFGDAAQKESQSRVSGIEMPGSRDSGESWGRDFSDGANRTIGGRLSGIEIPGGADSGNRWGHDAGTSASTGFSAAIQDNISLGRNAAQEGQRWGHEAGLSASIAFNVAIQDSLSLGDGSDEGRRFGGSLGGGIAAALADLSNSIHILDQSNVDRDASAAGNTVEKEIDGALKRVSNNSGGSGGSAGRSFASAFGDALKDIGSSSLAGLVTTGQLFGTAIFGAVEAVSALVSGLFAVASAAAQASAALIVIPGAIGAILQGAVTLGVAFQGVGKAISSGLNPALQSTARNAATSGASVVAAQHAVRDAIEGVATAQEDALRRTEDAERRVTDAVEREAAVRRDAAFQIRDALDAVSGAERDLQTAQQNELQAQQALTQARIDAKEALQQLQFQAEEANLSQERAQLNLEKATEQLAAVQDLPPDNRTRREAELAFKEAELNLREAKDRNSDLAKEQAKAAKAGVDGSKQVVDAKNAIAEAEQRTLDAERNLVKARQNAARAEIEASQRIRDAVEAVQVAQEQQARTAIDNAKSIRDAQQRLTDAQGRLAAAQSQASRALTGGSAAANKFQQAMKNLSPEAQAFVKQVISMKDTFKDLRAAAGQELFPKLTTSLQTLSEKFFPTLRTQLQLTGGTLGDIAAKATTFVTSPLFTSRFSQLGETNRKVLADFGDAAISLGGALTGLLTAAQPLLLRFSGAVADVSKKIEDFINIRVENGSLTKFFTKSGNIAAEFGSTIKDLAGLIFDVGRAAIPAGREINGSFDGAIKKLREFTSSDDGQKKLRKFFDGVAKNVEAIGNVLGEISLKFLQLGDNPGIRKAANIISKQLVPLLDPILAAADSSVPAFARLLTAVTRVIKIFADTGTQNAFIDALTTIVNLVADLVGLVPPGFLAPLLVVFATFKAAKFLAGFSGLDKAFASLKKGITGLSATKATTGIDGLKGASATLRSEFERQMAVDAQKVASLDAIAGAAGRAAGALDGVAAASGRTTAGAAGEIGAAGAAATEASGVTTAGGGAAVAAGTVASGAAAGTKAAEKEVAASTGRMSKLFAGIGKSLPKVLGTIGTLVAGLIGLPIEGVLAVIIGAIIVLGAAFVIAYKKSQTFRNIVNGALNAVKSAAEAVGKALATAFNFIKNLASQARGPLTTAGRAVGRAFSAIGDAATTAFGFIRDNFKTIGTVILLATGPLGLLVLLFIRNFNTIRDIVTTVFKGLAKAFDVVVDGISKAVQFLLPIFKVIAQIIGVVILIPIVIALTAVKLAFEAIATVITKLVIPAISFFVGLVKTEITTAIKIFGLLFDGIKFLVTKVFIPIWKGEFEFLIKGLAAVIRGIIRGVKAAFDAVVAVIKADIVFFRDHIWNPILLPLFNGLAAIIKAISAPVKAAMNIVLGALSDAFNFFIKNIWNPFTSIFGKLAGLIDKARSGIKSAWDKIKDIFSAPVQFVIDHVYNNGIRKFWNAIASKIGLGKLDPITFSEGGTVPGGAIPLATGGIVPRGLRQRFASGGSVLARRGGVLSGYEPGRDTVRDWLIPGQAVLRPEVVRALGKDTIERWNRNAPTAPADAATGAVPVILSKGEGVLRREVVERLGVNRIHEWNRWAMGGRSASRPSDPFRPQRFFQGGVVKTKNSGGLFDFPWEKFTSFLDKLNPIDNIEDAARHFKDIVAGAFVKSAEKLLLHPLDSMAHKFADGDKNNEWATLPFHSVDTVVHKLIDFLNPFDKQRVKLDRQFGFSGGVGNWTFPLPPGTFTVGTRFGPYPSHPDQFHTGQDFPAARGTPIRAVGPGRVVTSKDLIDSGGNFFSYGKYVKIQHANNLFTLYAHMLRRLVKLNQIVQSGETIGQVDSTGHAFGDHLHFEVRPGDHPIDPLPWLASHVGKAVNPGGKLTVQQNMDIVREAASAFGWDKGSEWTSIKNIVSRESSWNNLADNPNSTAYGLFQLIKDNWPNKKEVSDPAVQAAVGIKYIRQRYGDPLAAWEFWRKHGYYHTGGKVKGKLGADIPAVLQGGEYVLNRKQYDILKISGGVLKPGKNGRLEIASVLPRGLDKITNTRSASSTVTNNAFQSVSLATLTKVAHSTATQILREQTKQVLRDRINSSQVLHTGGWVGGMGDMSVLLQAGEYVFTRDQAAALRQGAIVMPTASGGLQVIAQTPRSGVSEKTVLTSEEVRALVALAKALQERPAGGNNFHVHPAPGMDEADLAAKVARRVVWNEVPR